MRLGRIRASLGVAGALAVLTATLVAGPAGAADGGGGSVPAGREALSAGWSVPWDADWLPDGSALYTERATHHIVRLAADGTRQVLGTVPGVVSDSGDGGLLGLAVSPRFAHDRTLYVFHSTATDNRIARLTWDGTTLGGYRPLLTGIPRGTHHNGGQLAFGPDGLLYAATGDALQPDLSQDPASPAGKILRLTLAGTPAPGNPFGTAVWAYGLRNAHGLAWDDDGRLWAADAGQDTHDELNLVQRGRNYGWPRCEGVCGTAGLTDPLLTWTPAEATPGGMAYADGALYLTGLRGQRLWRIPLHDGRPGTPAAYWAGELGRLRAVTAVPGGHALWLSTSNADQVGQQPGTDVVYRVPLARPSAQ